MGNTGMQIGQKQEARLDIIRDRVAVGIFCDLENRKWLVQGRVVLHPSFKREPKFRKLECEGSESVTRN